MLTLSTRIRPLDFIDPALYLRALYAATKAETKPCSYELFSERLGFGYNTYLHHIITGRRAISEKAACRISDELGLNGDERSYFLAMCRYRHARRSVERERALADLLDLRCAHMVSDLDRGQIEYLSEWYHPVVRELVTLPDFSPSPAWIAARVSPTIKLEQAAMSFRLLERLGYVAFDATLDRWRVTAPDIRTAPEVRSLAVTRFHQRMMAVAAECVARVPAAARDIGATTMTLTEAQFCAVRDLMRAARRQAAAISDDGSNRERAAVYQLNVQLFPVARGG